MLIVKHNYKYFRRRNEMHILKMRSDLIYFTSDIDPSETIPDFFSGKHVFITGGSGFMGKALIEKLLRTCPEIGNIYILLRPKFGKNLQERIEFITGNILFDKLKQENPKALEKLVPILGDVTQLQLGMSQEDREIIIENVSIVYHVAATVRFDETLADSIIMNTRGTREVCDLVLALKNISAFLHVSTAYCQYDKKTVEEILYEPHADWRKMIKIVESTDQYVMKIISAKIMDGFPNTYTLSKALAEAVIADMCEGKVPTIILRPTIVVSSVQDPMAGWVDNMNGPVGLVAASAKGILRSIYINYDSRLDFIAVDIAINSMIKATRIQKYLSKDKISIYNCSSAGIVEMNPSTIQEIGLEVQEEITPQTIWYPNFSSTDNKFVHMIKIYLYHLIPAVIIDLVLKCLKRPPRLLKIQRKIYLALGSLEYFMQNRWTFKNDKFLELDDYLHEKDIQNFYIDLRSIDVPEFFKTGAKVGLQLILKEDLSSIEKNYRNMKRMGYIHKTLKLVFSIMLIRFLFTNLLLPLFKRFVLYIESL